MYTNKYIICVCVVLSGVSSRTLEQLRDNSCKVGDQNGTCILVKSCDYILNLIKSGQFNGVKDLACGFEGRNPMACCPLGPGSIVFQNESEDVLTKSTTAAYSTTPKTPVRASQEQQPIATIDPFPDKSVCGAVIVADRIIGGELTNIDEFPWLVRIKYLLHQRETYACAGTLITRQHVLTAAHCVKTNKPVSVRLGEWNIDTDQDCYEGVCSDLPVEVKVKKDTVYPGYSNIQLARHDIALLQLEHPVNFTDWIAPICLPTSEYVAAQDYYAGATYTTSGWGVTEHGIESPVKRKVNLNAVPIEVCKTALPSIPNNSTPYIICAGGKKGQDSCRGDSGGPLFQAVSHDYRQNWYLYGITSFGLKSCGTEGVPGVYTRVTTYMKWIRDQILEDMQED